MSHFISLTLEHPLPESCAKCPFLDQSEGDLYCIGLGGIIPKWTIEDREQCGWISRYPKCPLKTWELGVDMGREVEVKLPENCAKIMNIPVDFIKPNIFQMSPEIKELVHVYDIGFSKPFEFTRNRLLSNAERSHRNGH